MYNHQKSKEHAQAWLEAERDLLINGCELSQDTDEISFSEPSSEEVILDPKPISKKDEGVLTRNEFMKTLKQVSQPLDKEKF